MKEKNILREAVILLIAALMMFSSGAVVANTINNHVVNQSTGITPVSPHTSPVTRSLVWDNVVGVHGSLGGIIVATVRTEGIAFPADDFKLETERVVDSVFWQGGYFQCQLAQGQKDYHWDWRILFWNDDGTENHPGSVIYNQTIPDAAITREFWYNYTHPTNGNTYWVANYSAQLPEPITFNANTKYWITIQGIQTPNPYPQACWSRHNNTVGGIKLHEAEILAVYWGYTVWTNISVLVTDGLPHDLNYQLSGPGGDSTPPTTTCTLEGTMSGSVYITPVKVTLTATDPDSGVNYTNYNVDGGAWNNYTAPFMVSDEGAHIITFYSVDKAGNKETDKTSAFTIQYPIQITIKGGLGIKATIKNTGTANLTNVNWTINLNGGIILVGKSKPGTIASLAVGAQTTVKDFVIGFGKTNIVVTAGGVSKNATGTVLLIFVIGVK